MALGGRKQQEEDSKTVEISAQMTGSLTFSDPVNLKINGSFKGSLDTKGTLTISSTATVDANIKGDNIVIAGRVNGDIEATKMLVLMPTAKLIGNVAAPKLNIVEGAIFNGNCRMGSEGEDDKFLNIDEVAKYLEIDLREIEQLANSGKIPARRNGNQWKFERSQIDTWASTGRLK